MRSVEWSNFVSDQVPSYLILEVSNAIRQIDIVPEERNMPNRSGSALKGESLSVLGTVLVTYYGPDRSFVPL